MISLDNAGLARGAGIMSSLEILRGRVESNESCRGGLRLSGGRFKGAGTGGTSSIFCLILDTPVLSGVPARSEVGVTLRS
jgi:hypothetical protein